MKRFLLISMLLLGIGLLTASCERNSDGDSEIIEGIWESDGIYRLEFDDLIMTSNQPEDDDYSSGITLLYTPYTIVGKTINLLGGLASMRIAKLTSSTLVLSKISSLLYGEVDGDESIEFKKVNGLNDYKNKLMGSWIITKATYYEGKNHNDETAEFINTTFSFSKREITVENEDGINEFDIDIRAGAIIIDDSDVLNIQSISSTSMTIKMLEYNTHTAEFEEDHYTVLEMNKTK